MAKKNAKTLFNLALWVSTVIVGLAVAQGLIDGLLAAPLIGATLNVFAGWVALVGTIIAVIGKIMKTI